MSLPWSAAQVEWLNAMGLDVLARPATPAAPRETPADAASAAHRPTGHDTAGVPRGLARAAKGVDLAPLLASLGAPVDVATRRAFWRALRPLRKAARRP